MDFFDNDKKSLKLANVFQFAQILTFAKNPGKKAHSSRAVHFNGSVEAEDHAMALQKKYMNGTF